MKAEIRQTIMRTADFLQKLKKRAVVFIGFIILFESLWVQTAGERIIFARENEIEISTPEDFKKLVESSGDDTYTLNKTFVLTKDLELGGRDIKPVQVFGGVFDGKGHSIKGFSYKGKQSGIGLFRNVLKSGEIKDLTVECEIIPTEDMKNIGGIAGVNEGLIKDCSVKGYVLGMEAVGGVAGRNTSSGEIIKCRNEAEIHGMRRTGGIAGYNEGKITSCENAGEVNTGSKTAWEIDDDKKKSEEEKALDDDEEIEGDSNENLNRFVPDNMDVGYDDILDMVASDQKVDYTGGIAGVNSGEVRDSVNSGEIGYPHLGYKSGGIVGYERGILDNCRNTAAVFGRKNTGGIAGQLEPYVKDEFSEDSLSRAQKEADLLVGMITALQESLKSEDDNIQEKIDKIRGNADRLRGSISSYKDYYRGKDDVMEADMRSHTTAIRDTLNGIDPKFKTGKTADALSGIQGDLDEIDKLMSAAEKAAASGVIVDMSNYLGKVKSIAVDLNEQADTMLKLAQNAGKEYNKLKQSASDLRDRGNSLDDFLRGAYDSYKTDIRSTDDDLTAQTDTIADCMDELSDAMKSADHVVRSKMDGITESLVDLSEDINEGFDEARGEIDRLRNTKDLNDIFDDVSDNPDPAPARGRITGCVNEGSINTDINGGGIAGMVDTDFDLRSDFKIDSEGDYSMDRNKTKLATITGCSNSGAVIVKNDCAGGIAGSMDIGAVESCENFGAVKTEDGDYAGGIAGKSGFMIRNSFSMAEVCGNQYVGGITGYGNRIIDNKALATIDRGVKEKYGSIAGDTDEEEKTVSGNIFVDESLGAVNGLTFENEAKGVSYQEFIALPGIPDRAKMMTVTFISMGEVIKTMEVPYGGSVAEEDYPELKNTEDKFGVWEDKSLLDIRQNTVVNAEYISFVTTVASDEAFPVMLVSGKFHKDAKVRYERKDAADNQSGVMPEGYEKILSTYSFDIISDYAAGDDNVSVRVLADEYGKHDTAAVINPSGNITVIKTVRDGRYLVFPYTLEDMGGEFCILKALPDIRNVAVVTLAAVVLLIIVIIQMIRKLRKKKKS